MALCECGHCGLEAKPERRFVSGHNLKIYQNNGITKGCKFNGKICPNCGKIHPDKTGDNNVVNMVGVKEKIRNTLIGFEHSEKTKQKMSKTWKRIYKEGKKISPMRNIKSRKKSSITQKELYSSGKREKPFAEKNGFYGHNFGLCKKCGKYHKSNSDKIKDDNNPAKRPEVRAKIKKSKEESWRDPNSIYNSLEYRQKQSGPNCNLWRGGISFEPYTPEFNKQLKLFIRTRDNFTCQFPDCGLLENGHKHSVHHINYNKKDCKPEKLILLCRSHNSVVNFNRQHWEKHFKEKHGN